MYDTGNAALQMVYEIGKPEQTDCGMNYTMIIRSGEKRVQELCIYIQSKEFAAKKHHLEKFHRKI